MIASADLDRIVERVAEAGLDEALVARLRGEWPGVHFTWCSDDDIQGPPPVRERPGFNLYLVDSRDHCLRLTGDAAVATGVVLASVEPE